MAEEETLNLVSVVMGGDLPVGATGDSIGGLVGSGACFLVQESFLYFQTVSWGLTANPTLSPFGYCQYLTTPTGITTF